MESLKNFDSYRKKFNFLYLCKSCARSFDSVEPTGHCRFCQAEGPEVLDMKAPGRIFFRYYCPRCEKNRLTEKKLDECVKCGNKHIHLYKWGKRGKGESARMRARGLMEKAMSRTFALRDGIRDSVKSGD
ncbi:MAG: hypothetical protein HYW27_04175 [Candidatus Aenigmarchaeota archaeon]|nr:hypothetical protein [Candidatus Aenigmarchaeota archaeon]